ncbi:hypothetical protein LCGC14_1725770 [marine sediment metagenome]|uniref:Uncharacterized protein n=1 Tax=marine sediment metagenome TaxID=412755 RepID=A0A0F9KAU8_9ZZZZ
MTLADLKEKSIALIAQELGDDFNVTTTLALYTVPTGKEFTPFAVCISKSSGSMTTATVSFGQSGALTDFLGTQTLTGINASGDAVWMQPVTTGATPVGIVTYTAGEIFSMDHVAAQGAGMTADVSVFGFLNDA